MNSVLRSKLTSAKRSESTVFELVFPDIEDMMHDMVGLFHIPGERDLYLDGVLSLANPRTYPRL